MNELIKPETQPLVYNSVEIETKGEMLSLTHMWKASGSDAQKPPAKWRVLPSTVEFISCVQGSVGKSDSDIIVTQKGGRNPGTWASWQIGLAYAKYLSPEFHMWCNEVVRGRMEGKSIAIHDLPDEQKDLIRRTDGISRMLSGKVTGIEGRFAVLEENQDLLIAGVKAIAELIQPNGAGIYSSGKTAGEIWKQSGFPKMNVSSWFSNRLCDMDCWVDGCRRVPVGSHQKLFDEDKASNWLRHGGRQLVEQYIAERQGQNVLKLVHGGKK